jgi:hypothetical protein
MYNEILASTPKYSGLNLFAIVNGEKYKFEISGSCEIDSIKNLFNNDSINISIIQEIKSWTDPETHTVRDTFISNKIFSKSICSNNLKDGYKEILISPAWNSYFPWNLFCCTVPKGVIEKAMLIRNSGSDWTLKGQRVGFLRCPN